MFCDSCGTAVQPGQNHCTRCGKTVLIPVLAGSDRIARHRQALGILWIVYAVLSLAQGVALFILANAYGHVGRLLRPDAAAGIIAGVGLLQWQSWARVLMLVVAFISLLSFPIGTGIGVYTLWVLLSSNAGKQYRAMAKAAGE